MFNHSDDNSTYVAEFRKLTNELQELLNLINKDLDEETKPFTTVFESEEDEDDKKQEAKTAYVKYLIAVNAKLREAIRIQVPTSSPPTPTSAVQEEGDEFDPSKLRKMLDPTEVKKTLNELQRNLADFSIQFYSNDPDFKLLNNCLEAGIKALKAPEDLTLAANFSKAAHELYEKKKDAPKWRKITSSLLKASATGTGIALGVSIGAQIGMGGLVMGTAVLGSLTLGGAVAVLAAALVVYLIAKKMRDYKNASQEEATKLKDNSKIIEGYAKAEQAVSKKFPQL